MTKGQEQPKRYRVISPGACAVWCEGIRGFAVPDPLVEYEADHFLVVEHPELFTTESAGRPATPTLVDSVVVETATARPGSRRGTLRGRR